MVLGSGAREHAIIKSLSKSKYEKKLFCIGSGHNPGIYKLCQNYAIGDYNNPKVRLPGSGGANDLASHAKKILIITRHEKRRFPKNCDYITSPGYINGPEGRKDAGIVVKYPDIVVITNLCVMEIDKKSGKLVITKLMPNISIDDVMINTEFKPLIKSYVNVSNPTKKEIDTPARTLGL